MPSKLWTPHSALREAADPPGLDRAPAAKPMFDAAKHRNVGSGPGISNDHSTVEWDNRLIACAVALGCPREHAEQARVYPQARFALACVWAMVQEANAGDEWAKGCVDRYRHAFRTAAVGSVGEAFSALEQELNPTEMQELMALD